MNHIARTSRPEQSTLSLIERAFLAAHLFTGSLQQAEEVTLYAIYLSKPSEEPDEALFQSLLEAAAQLKSDSRTADSSESHLPAELKAVLQLAPHLRRCFVLRILAGLSLQVCARVLRLQSERVDQYTCAALKCLGAPHFDGWHTSCSLEMDN